MTAEAEKEWIKELKTADRQINADEAKERLEHAPSKEQAKAINRKSYLRKKSIKEGKQNV